MRNNNQLWTFALDGSLPHEIPKLRSVCTDSEKCLRLISRCHGSDFAGKGLLSTLTKVVGIAPQRLEEGEPESGRHF